MTDLFQAIGTKQEKHENAQKGFELNRLHF
jgi:hypothetical protein